jgi:hypothetical protein
MVSPFLKNVGLEVPANWSDFSVVTMVGPEGGAFRANAVVTSEDVGGTDVIAYAKAQVKALKADAAAFKLVTEGATTVAGHAGYSVEFSFKAPEGQKLRQVQRYAALGGRVYTLSLTHLDDEFEKARPMLDQIAASFRLG